jgi:hypothetical protein
VQKGDILCESVVTDLVSDPFFVVSFLVYGSVRRFFGKVSSLAYFMRFTALGCEEILVSLGRI